MSVQPKAPGPPDPWWKILLAWLGLAAFAIGFGLLLSVPHPLTVLIARLLEQ